MKKYFLKAQKIYSFDPYFNIYSWILIENNKIIDLGNESLPSETNIPIYNFEEGYILPGFIDSHVHLSSTAISDILLDLSNFSSLKEIIKALEALRDSMPEGEWIIAKEFDPENMEEKTNITKEDLDKYFPKHPVLIIRKDAHSSIINTIGEKVLNLDLSYSEGEILTGRDHQIVVGKVYQNIEPSLLVKGILKILKKSAEKGVTTIHALEGGYTSPPNIPQLLLGLRQYFPIDVLIYYQTTSIKKVKELGLNQIGGCLLVDGSISSMTAALSEPYNVDNENYGVLYWDLDSLINFIRSAHNENLQIAFHAVGDRGIDLLLKAYKKVLKDYPKKDHRHRIEHFELPKNEHIKMVADSELMLSMQPSFLYFWGGEGKLYEEFLGKERSKRIIPLKSIIENNIIAGGGSDSSVTPIDPFLGIYSAVNHPNREESISIKDAIKMFTFNSAYIGFLNNEKGSIEKNKLADLVILDRDPLDIDTKDILDIKVLATICRGRFVYKNPSYDFNE